MTAVWTRFRTLWRATGELTQLREEVSALREEWDILLDRINRREARERKRKSRDAAAAYADTASGEEFAAASAGHIGPADPDDDAISRQPGYAPSGEKRQLWSRAAKALGTGNLPAKRRPTGPNAEAAGA